MHWMRIELSRQFLVNDVNCFLVFLKQSHSPTALLRPERESRFPPLPIGFFWVFF